MAHVYSPLDIRTALGVSVSQFARIVGCAPITVRRWESGNYNQMMPLYARRLRDVWRQYHRSREHKWPQPIAKVNPQKMQRYLQPPGSAYLHWTWKKRLSFMAHRARYQRILQDVSAGRCYLKHISE